jgi:hypothetical protein
LPGESSSVASSTSEPRWSRDQDELLVAQGLGVQAAAPGRHGAHDQLEPTAGQLREQLLSQA